MTKKKTSTTQRKRNGSSSKRTTTKKTPAKKATPKKNTTRKTTTRKRTVKKKPQPKPSNPLQKFLVFGVVIVFVTAILLLSLLSPNQGSITTAIAGWLRQGFGIGRVIVPFVMGALGIYCILIGIDNRPQLPLGRLLGGALLFFVIEAIASLWVYMRDFPDFWQLAANGRGGGYLGSTLGYAVATLVGDLGGIIIYGLIGIIALFFLFALSPTQIGKSLQKTFSAGDGDGKIAANPAPIKQPTLPIFSGKKRGVTAEPNFETREPANMRERIRLEEQRAAEIRERRKQSRNVVAPTIPIKKVENRERRVKRKKDQPATRKPQPATSNQQPATTNDVTQINQWAMPDVATILNPGYDPETNDELIRDQAAVIQETLASFGAPGNIVEVQRGPTVTQFGVEPGYILQRSGKRQKVKVSKIAGLADDLALALAAKSVRIQAPVPGKGYIGIEVPGTNKVIVSLRDVMESDSFHRIKSPLRIGLGQDVAGNAISADLAKMPHLLVAGATGSGKSVCVNAIIACLLLQNSPNDLRFVMVDPKRVELTGYNNIPHMAAPVVVDMDKVIGVLMWALREMDSRYQAFAKAGARNIITYNKKMAETGGEKLPYIVIIIDELADLMMTAPEDTERALARLAQMARATGMHMIIATQRPSVDVVTGLIKANFPARIAFAVSSSTDSRVILDQVGAERLLGQGDMLLQKPDAPAPLRMQGCYVSDDELNELIRYWKTARRFNTYTEADAEQKVEEKVEIEPRDKEKSPEQIVTVRPIEVERVIAEARPDEKGQALTPAPVKLQVKQVEPEPVVPVDLGLFDDVTPDVETQDFASLPVDNDDNAADDVAAVHEQPLPERIPPKPVQHLLDIEEENKQEVDELWEDAVAFVRKTGKASTSMLQRRFRIGYTRAARMIDEMEDGGIIGPPTGTSKAREVIGREG